MKVSNAIMLLLTVLLISNKVSAADCCSFKYNKSSEEGDWIRVYQFQLNSGAKECTELEMEYKGTTYKFEQEERDLDDKTLCEQENEERRMIRIV